MSGSSVWFAPIRVTRWILNTIFHQAIAVVAFYSIWVAIDASPFSWHVFLCTFGLILLGAEALMLYASDNVWSHDVEKGNKHIIHGVLMGLSTTLIIAGVAIEINRINGVESFTHFSTAHGITGLICMIFLAFALLLGFCAMFAKGLKGILRPVITKFIHNVIGIVAFIFGIVSLCCGYYTDWFQLNTSESSRTAATVTTVILCAWSLIPSFISAVKQVQGIMNVTGYHGVPIKVQGVNRPRSIVKLSQNLNIED